MITAPKPVIDEIKQILASDQPELLRWMRPMPDDVEDWYEWNVANWGTKWDIYSVFVGDDNEEDSIQFSFDTAWASPVNAFRSWASRDGRVTYRLTYIEPGMGFVGWDSYDGKHFDDDYVEQAQDKDRYWGMALEEFGYERDEEPEPLTEWYKEGVHEKGLDK